MNSRLSYLYVGNRFPEDTNKIVYVAEIARKAGISYEILKNRINIKKSRTKEDVITDKDLIPKTRTRVVVKRKVGKAQMISKEWLKKKLL